MQLLFVYFFLSVQPSSNHEIFSHYYICTQRRDTNSKTISSLLPMPGPALSTGSASALEVELLPTLHNFQAQYSRKLFLVVGKHFADFFALATKII